MEATLLLSPPASTFDLHMYKKKAKALLDKSVGDEAKRVPSRFVACPARPAPPCLQKQITV